MSDNNIKTNEKTVAETVEKIEKIEDIEKIEKSSGAGNPAGKQFKSLAEFLETASDEKAPMNNVGADRILELYQKVMASGLPDEDKENLTLNLLSEWKKILEDISEKTLSENAQPKLSVGYILSQMEKIQQDNAYIYKALETLSGIESGQVPGDVAGEGKANGIADTVKCRETTNQKLIAFYEKLYDDLKQTPADPNRLPLIDLINAIERCDAGAMNPETSKEMKELLVNRLKSDVGQKKTTKEMALDLVSQAFTRDFSDMDPEQIEAFSESISSVLDGVRHIDN